MKKASPHQNALNHQPGEITRQRLGLRQPSAALETLRQHLDMEIDIGLKQLARGEKIPGAQVFAEIRERSRQRRAAQNG